MAALSVFMIGIAGFNASGQLTHVLKVDLKTNTTHKSPVFVVPSPLAGCAAFVDASSGGPSFIIPDGSPEEDPPHYEYLTVSISGDVIRRVPAVVDGGKVWDMPMITSFKGIGYGLGNLNPPPEPQGNSSIISWDPVSGVTKVLDGSTDLGFIQEEPFCVGASDATLGAAGTLLFVNGVIKKQVQQQVFAVDVAKGSLAGITLYPSGIIQSVSAWAPAGGNHFAVLGLQSDPSNGAASTIVSIPSDPLRHWNPSTLFELPSGWQPYQGIAAVEQDTLYMLIHNDGMDNSDTLLVGDLHAKTFYTIPVGDLLSCCPFGVSGMGAV